MRVAIADHHQLFREAIKRLLESLAGVKIVGRMFPVAKRP